MTALEALRDLVAKGERASVKWRLDAVGTTRFISADGPVPADAPPDATCPRLVEAWSFDDLLFALAAANARPALRLLLEVVEAARERRRCEQDHDDATAPVGAKAAVDAWKLAASRLDTLLAQLEKQDDANDE